MNKLLVYFHGFKIMAVLAPTFKLIEALLELTIPLITALIIDQVIGTANQELLLFYVALMLVVGIISFGFSILGQYFSAKAAIGYTKNLSQDLFEKTISLNQSSYDQFSLGSLVSYITNDTFQIQTGLNIFFRLFLRSPFIVFGSLLMASQIDRRATTYFISMIIILFVILVGIIIVTTPYQQKIRQHFDQLVTTTRETMQGIRVIRAFQQEKREKQAFKSLNNQLTKTQQITGYISILTHPLSFITINITLILLINQGAIFINEGTLTQGQIVSLVNYLLAILVELAKLVMQTIRLNRAWVSAKRIVNVLNITQENISIPVSSQSYLTFKDVSFRYPKASSDVLFNLNFEIKENSFFGIIGGTGSGKTTIIKLISALYEPTKGQIVYNTQQLLDSISVVSGNVALFKGTIRSNLLVANEYASDSDMWQALEDAQATEFIKSLDEEVSAFGRNFSGGQRQRLTIARALLKESSILIFDDATSALDFLTEAKLLNTIKNYHDKTIIMISQRTRSLEQADHILVMEGGHQVGLGTHQQLLQSNEIYQEIYQSQQIAEGFNHD